MRKRKLLAATKNDLQALLSNFLDPDNKEEFLRPEYGVSRPWLVGLGFEDLPAWAKKTSEPPVAYVDHPDKHYYWFTREELLDGMAELYGAEVIADFLLSLEA